MESGWWAADAARRPVSNEAAFPWLFRQRLKGPAVAPFIKFALFRRRSVVSGPAARVMATLRNTALGLLRQTGATNIAAVLRHYGCKPLEAPVLRGVSAS